MSQAEEPAVDHFVDTNIIIGYTVNWDELGGTVAAYLDGLDEECTVHVSERAVEEASGVVHRQRRLAKRAARLVFEEFEPGRTHDEVEHIKNFVLSKLGSGEDKPPVSGLGGVLAFIDTNGGLFEGLTQTDVGYVFEQNAAEIDEQFDKPLQQLDHFPHGIHAPNRLALFTATEIEYSSVYPQYDCMDTLFVGEPTDRDILLDAFHLLNTDALSTIAFVTHDHADFISNRETIQACLSGISVFAPDEIVQNTQNGNCEDAERGRDRPSRETQE